MSAKLIETKKKIKSTKNTKKITKAMYLESSAKMKQFQVKALSARNYTWELLKVLGQIINTEYEQSNIYLENRTSGKTLFLLYTSDKGLCGALNSKLIKTLFNSTIWQETPPESRLLMTIGKKSYDYAQYNKIPVEKTFNSLSENMRPIDSVEIVDKIVKYWLNENIQKVIMTAPHYKNSLVFYPVIKTYLPFSKSMVEKHIGIETEIEEKTLGMDLISEEPPIIFEPDEESFAETLTEHIVQSLFLQSFLELKAAEYSNRAIAMKNATDAADDMVDTLTLNLNKARQASITQEIAEIMAGSVV